MRKTIRVEHRNGIYPFCLSEYCTQCFFRILLPILVVFRMFSTAICPPNRENGKLVSYHQCRYHTLCSTLAGREGEGPKCLKIQKHKKSLSTRGHRLARPMRLLVQFLFPSSLSLSYKVGKLDTFYLHRRGRGKGKGKEGGFTSNNIKPTTKNFKPFYQHPKKRPN